ncbi:STAS domain-containing protein [Gordonia soli]|uniref:Putative anti-sigma factor antagonist n=1 Tax=Gordonia soli NBRC 108243 TaxID=1223545 RepID=M0QNX1_9ACTN|nr:STAS domain-containing protein [Gordonia soli]GAC69961.1 putative anti-sigma factor antagonist [Gordonia soli NBRC 108243]
MSLNASTSHTPFSTTTATAGVPRPTEPRPFTTSFCVQRFSGDIDMQTAADFALALDRVLGTSPEGVVLDLSQVGFFGSSGLSLLATFAADAGRHGIPVGVVGPRTVTRPIEACHLHTDLDIFETVDQAGSALADRLAG